MALNLSAILDSSRLQRDPAPPKSGTAPSDFRRTSLWGVDEQKAAQLNLASGDSAPGKSALDFLQRKNPTPAPTQSVAPAANRSSSSRSSSSGGVAAVAPVTQPSGGGDPARQDAQRPDLNIPGLSMRRGASVAYQLAKLLGRDSLLMQQAKVKADETGVAGGTIHSSDQAGAAMRAMTDVASPIAQAEANLVASTDLQNWQSKATEVVTVYKAQFEDYLRDKGYAHEKAIEMARMQTSLNQTLMNNIGGLLNNPDIEFGDEVKKKLVDIFNAGLDNNNAILDLNLRY